MKHALALFAFSLSVFFLSSCVHPNYLATDMAYLPDPPRAEQIPKRLEKNGDLRIDKYFWLKERENPKVLNYLKAENDYTNQALRPVRRLEKTIFKELKSRTQEDESTAPVKRGEYFYYARYEKGQQYPIYARKKNSLQTPEEILIDINALAKGHTYCQATGPMMSPNQEMMAYGVDLVGRRFFTIYFKNLKTGELLSQTIPKITGNLIWAADNQTVFYAQQNPETLRPEKAFRYNLSSKKSELVYFEKDETFSLYLSQSLTRNYIYLNLASTLTNEVRYLRGDQPAGSFKIFAPRVPGHEYTVTDGDDSFYIVTNRNAKNYRLMKTSFGRTEVKNWQEVIPYDANAYLSDVTVFKNYFVLDTRTMGLPHIQIFSKDLRTHYEIPFADASYVAAVGANAEYDTDLVRYDYESMRLPESNYDFNMQTRKQELKKARQVPNFNPQLYVTERVFITARDGQKVPISLVMKRETAKNNKAPLLIYGYGSYGVNMDPSFSQSIFSLVDRGFVYAIAHIRGGSEMGRDWYDQGRTMNKQNTFHDFIDSTEALIKLGYADPKRVYAMGGSAGGLLMGAVINMRPDLYRGVVAQVPFVDVLTTMLDTTIPLTTGEYDEWGNPNKKKVYDYIKSYSPYDNVSAKNYPHMLVTTGLQDSQVQYWEPAKWVAKLRELQTNKSLILLKTDMESGHGGASGRFDQLQDSATEFAFLLLVDGNY